MDDRCLLFFIKDPGKGRVKTRLASAIGDKMAVKLYRRFLLEMLFTLNRGTFLFYLCYSPENSLDNLKDWLGDHYLYMSQGGENLGEKMKNGFVEAFSMSFKRVVLIGSDIPDLPLEFIEEAFTSLREKDVVIGPSFDGGYYLIGFKDKTFSPRVFDGIHWSTESVFEKTLKVLTQEGLTVHTLQPLRDIDTVEDLRIRDLRKKEG
ncbi:MAG: TIGR04282 family arsenosugar biosynthesis glycosyltransferase [Desulfobacterales bacterium]|nr:TIGR04282 family arsenosugar biosynthesis glycosyltransferase [Desulfobacterales bacterium]